MHMITDQISIFIENRRGRLAEILSVLEREKIAIHALSLADTSNFGILRIIARDHASAIARLHKIGVAASENRIISITPTAEMPVSQILTVLSEAGLFVEYMYTIDGTVGSIAVSVNDADAAEAALCKAAR